MTYQWYYSFGGIVTMWGWYIHLLCHLYTSITPYVTCRSRLTTGGIVVHLLERSDCVGGIGTKCVSIDIDGHSGCHDTIGHHFVGRDCQYIWRCRSLCLALSIRLFRGGCGNIVRDIDQLCLYGPSIGQKGDVTQITSCPITERIIRIV